MKTELKCPNCKEVFKVDETGYSDILRQVRDEQFKEEIEIRLSLANEAKDEAIKLAEAETTNSFKQELAKKQNLIIELKAENNKASTIIEALKRHHKTEKQLAINDAVDEMKQQLAKLSNQVENNNIKSQLQEKSIIEKYEGKLSVKNETLKIKEDEISRLKEYKQKLSTKMLGETLEQHCEIEFNKLRPTAFKNAHFEKDNDSTSGSKGDYIYRESDEADNEIISIMFEMKNENECTEKKQKNEDFLKKLDKDRNQKNCEYAVLVTVLESDNELYNTGIVDVSHKFNKMYIVRPQFFIPIITLLRNAAMNSMQYKAELNIIRNQNIDITNFEDKITAFKTGFTKNSLSVINNFENAIKEIDKSIKRMEAIKKALFTSINQLRLANNKTDSLTIKKLTYNNPTMKKKFDERNKN